jgi:uncharacterized protein VirK/YbjX
MHKNHRRLKRIGTLYMIHHPFVFSHDVVKHRLYICIYDLHVLSGCLTRLEGIHQKHFSSLSMFNSSSISDRPVALAANLNYVRESSSFLSLVLLITYIGYLSMQNKFSNIYGESYCEVSARNLTHRVTRKQKGYVET